MNSPNKSTLSRKQLNQIGKNLKLSVDERIDQLQSVVNLIEEIKFIPFQKQDLNEAFDLYKSALHQIIENVFGWDEGFQRNRFETQYKLEWFNWIEIESKRTGYICYFQNEDDLHISLIIMFEEFQNKGFGKIIMSKIENYAHAQNKKVTLSSFTANGRAVKFYKSMGYVVIGEDEHFLDLSKS